MYEIDASSIVHAWENYPITQFPKLWDWFADEFESNKLSISKVAFDEVAHKFPELSTWLNNLSIEPVKTNVEIIKIALTISQQLGIDDDYSKKGVDENTFNDLIQEKFVTYLCDGSEVELLPNGKSMLVTFDKRVE